MSISSARRVPLAVALTFSAAVIAAAPFLGQLRALLRAAFPGRFVSIVGAAVVFAAAAAFALALTRIRTARGVRYGAMAAAAVVAVGYSTVSATGIPEVDVVERVHFVEYGLIAMLFYLAWRGLGDVAVFVLPVLAALTVGTLDEWLQWFIPNRVGEARDVFLNLVAIASGLTFAAAVEPPTGFAFRLHPRSRRLLGVVGSTMLVTFAGFFRVVHLGHLVIIPDVAAFTSRYRAQELVQLSAERRDQWRHDPPLVLRRLSREDQYLDEGLWHVRRRNELWTREDYYGAWKENQILETFFAPVLDTATYAAPVNRWPPEQRADAQQRAAGAGRTATSSTHDRIFMSTAEPYPIFVGVKGLDTVVAGLALLLLSVWARRTGDQEWCS